VSGLARRWGGGGGRAPGAAAGACGFPLALRSSEGADAAPGARVLPVGESAPWAAPVAELLRAAAARAGGEDGAAPVDAKAEGGPFSPPAALLREVEAAVRGACGAPGGAPPPGACTRPRAACAAHAAWELRFLDWADTEELRAFSQLRELGTAQPA
jgi:hypothetical protein